MSVDGQEPQGNKQVIDEEGEVDTKVKDTIIDARNRVDQTKHALDVKASLDPEIHLEQSERIRTFAKTVKQYLIRIEPLLRSDEIKDNEQYYWGGEEPLATFQLVPQDTPDYQFSLVTRDYDDETLRQMLDLPRGADLPAPQTVTFAGLKDVIEKPSVVNYQWEVCVEKGGAPPNWEFRYPKDQRLVPEQVYIDAIREADLFLQDIGIGVETGLPEIDERSEPF